ncbi:unnamed protein product [Paramecium primaurelia]|uniref:Trichocyst matrix protein n=1 Tax=Paramecium primaurelia TaxID=5886 RepID=A0A8S1JS49_PARPR|nr:unnamed protein product [Paramecium primaurelia]
MKFTICFLLGLVTLNAVFVKKPSDPNAGVFAELEEIEEHALGRKLLDTIALQMKNQAPLADIARMLQELRENLLLQQQQAELKHAADEADCAAEIAGYNRRIDYASNEISESTTEITALSAQVQQLESEIENIQVQLGILNDQEETLRTQRAKDAEAFAQRIKSTADVVEALNVVAAKLSAIQPEQDPKAVFLELHNMGKSNPIAALVSIASAFSKERLQQTQDKIAELRQSIEQSAVDDQEAEVQAQIDYQNMLAQFADQRKNFQNALKDNEAKLTQTENALGAQKKRKEDAGRELATATAGKTQKENDCEALRTQYARDSEQRTKEIGIIRQVEEILATKLEGASGYLKSRIN